MRAWASCGLFQIVGSSALAFSSSSRRSALSQSKMPPQQVDRLLDFADRAFGLWAHELVLPTYRYAWTAKTCKGSLGWRLKSAAPGPVKRDSARPAPRCAAVRVPACSGAAHKP